MSKEHHSLAETAASSCGMIAGGTPSVNVDGAPATSSSSVTVDGYYSLSMVPAGTGNPFAAI
jgi:hypothetical protein